VSLDVLNTLMEQKIIAIVRGVESTKIVDLANAMVKGGMICIEVTFDQSSVEGTEETLASIRQLRQECPHVCVGAGTVMNVEQVRRAIEAGAEYIISPNVDENVVRETKRLGKISIPGALTATEVAYAHACGADIVKMFPAGILGPGYLKAIKAPLQHIPLTAVGGITVENCAAFIKAGAVGVGVGGNLVSLHLINEGRFDEITAIAKAYVEALRGDDEDN